MACHDVGYMSRWVLLCGLMTLICELGIIVSTFIFFKNEIAWQKWLKEAGRSSGSRDKMAMLSFSLAVTASIILLTVVGGGNIAIGLKNTWRGVRKVSTIMTSIDPSMVPHWRTFKTFVHPMHNAVDPNLEDEAPVGQFHGSKSISATVSK
jgi:hypothetical protein